MFRFPLQRLLELKALREREIAREFAEARRDADGEQVNRDRLATLHDDANRQLAQTIAGAPTAGEVMSLVYSVSQLRERLGAAVEATSMAEQVAREKQGRLTGAMQERQVLSRLREKRLGEHKLEETAREQSTMDDIALTRFNASRDGDNDGRDST